MGIVKGKQKEQEENNSISVSATLAGKEGVAVVSVRKIAAVAGISPATVSRYINDTAPVSEEAQAKIRGAIHKLGYDELPRKSHKAIIMILLTHLHFSFYSKAIGEFLDQERDGRYIFALVQYDPENAESVKSFVTRMKPAGAVYFEEEIDNAILEYLQDFGIKTVMCGGVALNHESDMVHVNDILAAYDGTNYLLGLGHEQIVFLSDEVRKIGAGYQRIMGSRKAMEEQGIELPDERIVCGPVTFDAGYRETKQLLQQKIPFTAIFAFSDELAVGAMAALYDAGVRVPQDVSVLGFDDLEIASKIRPALTTIRQPIESFVQKALEIFSRPADNMHSEILLQHTIAERGSCQRCAEER